MTAMFCSRSRSIPTLVVFTALWFATVSTAQLDWVQRASASNAPDLRRDFAMAYDSIREVVVLFGGFDPGSSWFNDTWEWNGTVWTQVAMTGPSARRGHAMAFDPNRGVVVLFGGNRQILGPSRETWEWDGMTWTDRTTPAGTPPLNRFNHAMTFDAGLGRVFMFGGGTNNTAWSWNGTTWSPHQTGPLPANRTGHGLVYDSARSKVVMFGGLPSGATCQVNQTWEWDGVTWANVTTPGSPTPRGQVAMDFDVARGRTVLFGGGVCVSSPFFGDTWECDGTSWGQRALPTSPSARTLPEMVYDSARRCMVLVGGVGAGGVTLQDTWEFGVRPGYSALGSGCAGSNGVPVLASCPGGLGPIVGQPFCARLSNIPPSIALPVFLTISFNPLPMAPLSLDSIGMTGCALWADPQNAMALTKSGSMADWNVPIPLVPAMGGMVFFNQGFVVDPLVNPLGLTVSNAAEAVIGLCR